MPKHIRTYNEGEGVAGKVGTMVSLKLTLSFLGCFTLLFLWEIVVSAEATWIQTMSRTCKPNHTLVYVKKELP